MVRRRAHIHLEHVLRPAEPIDLTSPQPIDRLQLHATLPMQHPSCSVLIGMQQLRAAERNNRPLLATASLRCNVSDACGVGGCCVHIV
jgi:hypothetical protein